MNRRQFGLAAAGIAVGLKTNPVMAEDKVDPSDPTAAALGYSPDASTVDTKKFPRFDAAQNCASCQLFQGGEGDEWAPCSIFANKQVPRAGWCNAWIQKVG